ncbi:unnamed protein product [Larinioides sclopetarius]|uniref:DUF19 domain-containing protein n=1 Tax=Larinioides sclopetarius TaxID=280406 RepID=A0AAV2BMS1_9ARAC
MTIKVLLFAFSVLLLAKDAQGCQKECHERFHNSELDVKTRKKGCRPGSQAAVRNDDVHDTNKLGRTTTYIRCLKEYQDKCGFDSIGFFSSPDVLEAYFNTTSELCEEGTSLNTVAIENLQCFNETLSKTNCRKEARNVSSSYVRRRFEEAEFEPQNTLNLECLEKALSASCIVLSISENCGKDVGYATLDFIRRSKILENVCLDQAARLILDELHNLQLSEDKIQSVTLLLEKPE